MDDYLAKPLRPQLLLAAFDKYLFGITDAIIVNEVTNSNKLEHFDRADILKDYNNEEQIIDTLLAMAFNSIPQYISDLQTAIMSNDSKQIKFNAHTLKGMARGIGFTILADYALQIEKYAESHLTQCNELYIMIVKEFEFLKTEYGS